MDEGRRVSYEEGEVRGAVRMDEGSCMKQERGGMKEDGLVSWSEGEGVEGIREAGGGRKPICGKITVSFFTLKK